VVFRTRAEVQPISLRIAANLSTGAIASPMEIQIERQPRQDMLNGGRIRIQAIVPVCDISLDHSLDAFPGRPVICTAYVFLVRHGTLIILGDEPFRKSPGAGWSLHGWSATYNAEKAARTHAKWSPVDGLATGAKYFSSPARAASSAEHSHPCTARRL